MFTGRYGRLKMSVNSKRARRNRDPWTEMPMARGKVKGMLKRTAHVTPFNFLGLPRQFPLYHDGQELLIKTLPFSLGERCGLRFKACPIKMDSPNPLEHWCLAANLVNEIFSPPPSSPLEISDYIMILFLIRLGQTKDSLRGIFNCNDFFRTVIDSSCAAFCSFLLNCRHDYIFSKIYEVLQYYR